MKCFELFRSISHAPPKWTFYLVHFEQMYGEWKISRGRWCKGDFLVQCKIEMAWYLKCCCKTWEHLSKTGPFFLATAIWKVRLSNDFQLSSQRKLESTVHALPLRLEWQCLICGWNCYKAFVFNFYALYIIISKVCFGSPKNGHCYVQIPCNKCKYKQYTKPLNLTNYAFPPKTTYNG